MHLEFWQIWKLAFLGQGFGFSFLDVWEPGFGLVIFKGFGSGFVVYQSFDFATNLFDCKTHVIRSQ